MKNIKIKDFKDNPEMYQEIEFFCKRHVIKFNDEIGVKNLLQIINKNPIESLNGRTKTICKDIDLR